MRPRYATFVDREKELRTLIAMVRAGEKILIKGRRGVGKSALAYRVLRELEESGERCVWVDCLLVSRASDLLAQLSLELGAEIRPSGNEREDFMRFFSEVDRRGVKLLVLDEFTNLFNVLARRREFGGLANFAGHLRSLISGLKASVIATTSRTSEVRRVVKRARIFGRTFGFVHRLNPLDMRSSLELVSALEERFGSDIREKEALVVHADFVPFYIEALAKAYVLRGTLREAIAEEFESGTLAEYFKSLLEDLTGTQRAVIYQLASGRKKYEDLERAVGDSDLAQALDELLEMDLVGRIAVSRKNVFYTAKDRTFASWVLYSSSPKFRRDFESFRRFSTLGFEALVRETLGALTKAIAVEDRAGRRVQLGPFKHVGTLSGRAGQLDVYAVGFDGSVLLGECYFGRNPPAEKIRQLERFADVFPESVKVLFYISGESKELRELAVREGVYLFDIEILQKIRRETPLHPF